MTAHHPHFTQSQRWVLAVVLSGAGWTLLLIASMSEFTFPLAAWSIFLWISAATVVGWAILEHISHRDRQHDQMSRDELAEVITKAVTDAVIEAIVDEGLIQRLPKQRP